MGEIRVQLNDFLIGVQSKALRQTEIAVGNRDEALDIVQEAMLRLAQRYANKMQDWPKLFQRILQNLIYDWYRRQKVRSILFWWNQTEEENEAMEDVLSKHGHDTCSGKKLDQEPPEKLLENEKIGLQISLALKALPLRQQQAFLLRAWWGHDIEETAFMMNCSTGSVKTHYSRAINKLQQQLSGITL